MTAKEKKNVQVKIDKDTSDKVEQILEDLGLTITDAMAMYFRRIVADGKIPFDISLSDQEREK